MNKHETYVSFEIAKLLKKLRFKWEDDAHWSYYPCEETRLALPDKPILYAGPSSEHKDDKYVKYCPGPTLEVAKKWLRSVKGWSVNACNVPELYGHVYTEYQYMIAKLDYKHGIGDIIYPIGSTYKTYEAASEAGVLECLKLILAEKEVKKNEK